MKNKALQQDQTGRPAVDGFGGVGRPAPSAEVRSETGRPAVDGFGGVGRPAPNARTFDRFGNVGRRASAFGVLIRLRGRRESLNGNSN